MQGRVSTVEPFVADRPWQRGPSSASDFNSCPSPKQAWGRFDLSTRAFSGLTHLGELKDLGPTSL